MSVAQGGTTKQGGRTSEVSLDAATAAWLTLVPCAVATTLAIVLLGRPLGEAIYPDHPPFRILQSLAYAVRPEPTEQARYLIALGGPILLALVTIAAVRHPPPLTRGLVAIAVPVAQVLTGLLLIASIAGQYMLTYGPLYSFNPHRFFTRAYFTPVTLAAAIGLAVALTIAAHSESARARVTAWTQESRPRQIGALLAAATMTAVWMTTAINSDSSIANAIDGVRVHIAFTFDETFAVVNGLTPLVDFTAQYGSLWPFLAALPLVAFGKTLLVFTITMCAISSVALLAVFGVLRRVTRSSLLALLLYLPFLATSLFTIRGTFVNRYSLGSYFGAFPLRYAGPLLLAWLVARRLDSGRTSRDWLLFTAAGLVVLNNVDYGVAALGASVAALVWTAPELRWRPMSRLAGSVAFGLGLAFALVSALTLVRAGSLPELHRLVDYARVFSLGMNMLPIHGVVALHLLIYATYVAAIATATVRAVDSEPNRVLTGMLAWSGIFGLGSAVYYVGRSHPETLVATFPPWALSLVLLAVVVLQRLAATPERRIDLPALAVLAGLGIAVCSLAQTPTPWSQVHRIESPFFGTADSTFALPLVPDETLKPNVTAIADGTRWRVKRGAPVAIMLTNGHRIADAFGVVDVVPRTGLFSTFTVEELDEIVATLRDAGGNTMLLQHADPQIYGELSRLGFKVVTRSGLRTFTGKEDIQVPGLPYRGNALTKWVDTRHLHAPALHAG